MIGSSTSDLVVMLEHQHYEGGYPNNHLGRIENQLPEARLDDHNHIDPQIGYVDTAVHVQFAQSQIQVMQIPQHNSEHDSPVQVNSRNNLEFIARLDLDPRNQENSSNSQDIINDHHGHVITFDLEAGLSDSTSSSNVSTHRKYRCCLISSSLLKGSGLIAGSTYTSIFNLKDSNGTIALQVYGAKDVISHPELLPNNFYSIMFMTLAFTSSIIGVLVPLWSMTMKRSYLFRSIPFLGLGAFFLSYVFTIKGIVPKFQVNIGGSLKISSFCLVWLCGLCLLLLLLAIWLVTRLIIRIISSFCLLLLLLTM